MGCRQKRERKTLAIFCITEVFNVIARLPADVSILFIEHDMELVRRFAERITVLVSGKVLTEGTPDEIMSDRRVREVYLGEGGHD